ncbi:hypothetical protein C8D87_114114 [Lentzea atacamensis]|uniref:Uncharacterized protein n=1 Tax=Lentzea atacamensis TaxID=531938 RepID=A0ABX9DWG9_9PSEU|nr:hypothetical protein [Lentzea atacamensis]RAS59502.1 hypothetical protein C8D87_114114 [Lentzea atacamensis]
MALLELTVRTITVGELTCHCHFERVGSYRVGAVITCLSHKKPARVTSSSVVLPGGLITSSPSGSDQRIRQNRPVSSRPDQERPGLRRPASGRTIRTTGGSMTTAQAAADAFPAVWIRVFHNNHATASGYAPGQSVTEVFTYVEDGLDDHVLLGRAFDLFYIGHDPEFGTPDRRAVEYRDRGNRSLAVGDVVAIDDRFYAFDHVGCPQVIERPPIRQRAGDGTVPMY